MRKSITLTINLDINTKDENVAELFAGSVASRIKKMSEDAVSNARHRLVTGIEDYEDPQFEVFFHLRVDEVKKAEW